MKLNIPIKQKLQQHEFSNTNIQDSNLKYILLASIFFAFILSIYSALIRFSYLNIVTSIVSLTFLFFLYYLQKFNIKSDMIRLLLVLFLNFILFPIAWFTNYGIEGPMIIHSFNFILISLLLVRRKSEQIFAFLLIIEVLLLWFFDQQLFENINIISSLYNIRLNLQLHYFIAAVVFTVLISINQFNANRVKQRLTDFTIYDELTGLFSRRYVIDQLNIIHDESKRTGNTFCLCMLDIDNFKKVNDIYGHRVGDDVLSKLGKVIQQSVRQYDIAARYGGDEFIIIIKNVTENEAESVLTRIQDDFLKR